MVYFEPPQPNVDIQANTKFDIERYLSEDIPKTDTILEIKLKSEKYYPDLTLKLDSQYLNFSYIDYINYTYNNSDIVKPLHFIPPCITIRLNGDGIDAGDPLTDGSPTVVTHRIAYYDYMNKSDRYSHVYYDAYVYYDSINEKFLICNKSDNTGFVYDCSTNTLYSADIKLYLGKSVYKDENFPLYPNEEKTFCLRIDFLSVPKDQKSTEITIELIDNNRSNLDSSYVRITKFINITIPSAKIRNLCNNIVKYVSARKPDKRIKAINYNFGQISTTDEIKLWFILFVPKYVEFLSTNVEIQNRILDICKDGVIKAIMFLQGLANAIRDNLFLFVTFLYAFATVLIAYLTYRSRPILIKAIEEHTSRLRKLAEGWLEEIKFDEVEKPLMVLKKDQFQIEKEFLFEDLKLHVPKEINMLDLWEKFKKNIDEYNK